MFIHVYMFLGRPNVNIRHLPQSLFLHACACEPVFAHIHAHIPCLSTLCSETVSVNLEVTDRAVSPVWATPQQSPF